jgi:hypothetical protein
MIPSEAKAANHQALLEAKNCTDTAGASGGWVDCRGAVGDLLVIQNVGAMTANGTLAGALLTSNAANGAGNSALTFDDGNNFTSVSASNNIQGKTVDANKNKGWIKYVGTIVTGPHVIGVTVHFRPKESA